MGTTMNNSKPDTRLVSRPAHRVNDAWPENMPRSLFVDELLARRLPHIAQDEFRGVGTPDRLAPLGQAVLVRSDRIGDEVEALLRLPGDTLALIDAGYAHVSIEVAGSTRAAVDAATRRLRAALAISPPERGNVTVGFWMLGRRGGDVRHREIEAPMFETIAGNYARAVRDALAGLLARRAPDRGRLILWRGPPGTGKSYALRALVRAWAPWCSSHFILDPEELFGRGGAYLLDVLTWDGDGQDQWRLVILEDAGELIASDARTAAGQGLSRLLNVTEGLLGQGTRTLILITTNEPLKRLHPATRRAGRCLADIEFAPLSVAEANAWLRARGHDRPVDKPMMLAELFSHPAGGPSTVDTETPSGFGFSRALVETGDHVR
jgi:hypothetical protein